jgi:Uncharacterized homolog of the cytoplasmic domain of flagellar protein FhlB
MSGKSAVRNTSLSEKKSVALKYPDGAPAPFITACAKGALAQKILEIAEENSIPVVKNKETADILSVQEIGSFVPEETWTILAAVFAFVKNTEGRKNNE